MLMNRALHDQYAGHIRIGLGMYLTQFMTDLCKVK